MFNSISISWFLLVFSLFLFLLLFSCGVDCYFGYNAVFNGYFVFDCVSFYLILLVLILGICSYIMFSNSLSTNTYIFLFLSLVCSSVCFCINHCIIFWVVYELSMLPLLYLIFAESPYSERFLAGWYFAAYLIITSLPLLLIFIYISFVNGSLFFNCWYYDNSGITYCIFLLLSFVFFTKIPLFPFHTWLPIVHAEATSIVSIFLSGYIMKLGLLGIYRCTYFIFNSDFIVYLFLCCVMSILFFVTACNELDGKRWLAFLSLSHIVIPFIGLFVGDFVVVNFSFFYCLGHGISAGIVFGLLWYFYELSNSRNWILLKSSLNGKTLMLIVVFSMLTLCSFPLTIQFFCEVCLIKQCYGILLYVFFWCLYLFFGGLIPLVLCGHLLIRVEFCDFSSNCIWYCFNYFLVVLCIWCYFSVLFL
uniref:NADH-ubiquinone oxidoreductase chain 4 n=1 Tax=Paruterina candelabraria TaxID=2364639 RepID=A0A386HV58_9CEST|nr:NADH dehydrogenase subunit 4 [Paruterina candelabraria]AYD49581.1 NADH dehydrogenase subunit 4 [Paruterina candelabraria]